jgi:hypothetical protein
MYFKRQRARLEFHLQIEYVPSYPPFWMRGVFFLASWPNQRVIEMTAVKVYYFSGDSLCGRLRAVLHDGMYFVRLASSQAFTYLGDRFPQMNIGDPPAAIIEILPDTQPAGWRTGFYLAAQPPLEFEQTLRAVRD